MDIIVHAFWWPNVFISLGYISRSRISMTKDKLIFSSIDTEGL